MPTSFVIGLHSYNLSPNEKNILSELDPLGIILFKRNIESVEQTQSLIQDARIATNNPNLLILIDEEGGKVSRSNHIFNDQIISAETIGKLYLSDPVAALELVTETTEQIIRRLKILDVNACCAPVCDLFFGGANDVIGSRAYSGDPKIVSILANRCCEVLAENDILPIIKHIPGHGRSDCDSHLELPIITTSKAELVKTDFAVFKALNQMPIAMTAHIVYEALDPEHPVTTSKKAIDYIRHEIGFTNMLISDDLCMKALKGTTAEKAKATLDAGCDIVLHCNGDIKELEELLQFQKSL
ncbi:MAG: glycoside hydrolase family 3 protein [Rickettsiales bacterium]|nr:glycoside hydrolase family 3 protein [Rickettsiales bacterium]